MLKQGTPRMRKHTHSQSHQSLVEDDFWHLVHGFLWYGKHDWNEHLKYSDGFHSRPKVDLARKHLTSHAQSDWVVSKRPYRCDDVSSEAPNHQHSSERKNPPNCECFDLQLAHSARKAVEQLEVMQKQGDRDDGNTLESFRWRIESQWGLCLFVWASKASENLFHFWNAPQKKSLDKMGPFCFLAHWKKTSSLFFGRLKPGGFVFHGWPHPNCVTVLISFGNPRVSPMESPPVFPGGGREQWASEFGGLGTRVVPGVHPTSLTYGRLIFALEA